MKNIFVSILISVFGFYVLLAQAQGEMIMVESKIDSGNIYSLQFTLNGEHYSICTGGSEYCPNRIFISIDPNKEYNFNLYNYEGSGYQISDTCKKKIIVKPNTGRTIKVFKNGSEIICN